MRDVFLQRTRAVDDWDSREVVWLRGRRGRPLERVGLPRVVARDPAVLENDAVEEVEEEHRDRDTDDVSADRRDEVQTCPLRRLRVMKRPTRRAIQAELMQR